MKRQVHGVQGINKNKFAVLIIARQQGHMDTELKLATHV